ncbi:RNA polymerase sigma factor [Pedobacter nyackensis]|uniref:RNA polymerase sigma-70 factor, ECF subfamily n=1 Tax=Pedobacter nyackensis TaxID=475255 RepID=A0A1W2E1I1_9SPHI|nr:RNA polymerase sigma-70 factor [Pedobacter nyackensis]SMD02908.1 RNA polymerase sigma-70 factor, ECF subfamily [Pedobacter nyackensis]
MLSYSTFSDSELISMLRLSNRAAYTEIYKRYTAVLYSHAYSKLQDREEARDAIQELFTTLWLKRENISIETNLSGYLYCAVRNRVLNTISHKRVASNYFVSIQEDFNRFESITDHRVRENELAFLIEKEIASLPPKMREVFELSRKSNLSRKEIATQLNLSEKTVKNQINNALKVLKLKFDSILTLVIF